MRIRKITPEEAWRLMGFSNEDYLKASKYVCKTQLYKQAGNSIVVSVMYEILKSIFQTKTVLYRTLIQYIFWVK